MRQHMPFFRWVASLGLILIGGSLGLFLTAPDPPDTKQIDLTVIHEQPSGACTVRWTDTFGKDHQGPYTCDAERSSILKAPSYDPATGYGWDTGFVITEGPHKGDLDTTEIDDEANWQLELSDDLLIGGVLLTIVGVVGGNIRSLARMTGVNPGIVRRAGRLREAAALVAQDHRLALESVRAAWTSYGSLTAPEVLAPLRVLVDAGPRAAKVAQVGGDLTARLDPLLAAAAPAAGRRQMLGAGAEDRRRALAAVGALRVILDEAEARDLAPQFAQASVDLLRGPDTDAAGLSTRVDFESRPAEYRSVLAGIVDLSLPAADSSTSS